SLLREIQDLGVTFVSRHEALDFSTATGRLMFHVIAALAEFERDLIRERVKAGMANAKAKGKPIGRHPKIALGDLRTVVDLRGRGESIRGIAGVLGVSKSAVHKALLSPAVRGAEESMGIPSAAPVLQGPV
ncbi:MAG: recombinase family protein, partial [Nitrospirae bacterium]|nr:recombinase family protein [Nitrospirota bacterium]